MIEIKKLDSRVEKMISDLQATEKTLNKLIDENPWVRAEKDMFGDPNSAEYKGISTLDIPNTKLMYHRLLEENQKLKK